MSSLKCKGMKSSLFSGLRDGCSLFSGVKDGLLHRMISVERFHLVFKGRHKG